MLTDRHPTREQWHARQAALPERARAMLEAIERKEADERNARDLDAARRMAATSEWRAEFEAAVAAELVMSGAEWLAAHRVPDYQCAKLPEFTGAATTFFALFDANAFGLWPIALHLAAGTGAARVWHLPMTGRWRVLRPSGDLTYRTFEEALWWSAAYVGTPF